MDERGPIDTRGVPFNVSPTSHIEESWLTNSKLVLTELGRLEERSIEVQKQISSLEVKIAKIEVKMAFVSVVWTTIIVSVLEFFLKRN